MYVLLYSIYVNTDINTYIDTCQLKSLFAVLPNYSF